MHASGKRICIRQDERDMLLVARIAGIRTGPGCGCSLDVDELGGACASKALGADPGNTEEINRAGAVELI